MTIRNYRGVTWDNLGPLVETNNDLNTLFNKCDPNIIAEKLLNGLNSVIKQLITIKRVQLTSRSALYWNGELERSREAVKIKMNMPKNLDPTKTKVTLNTNKTSTPEI